jgi:hypothetical protein
MIGFILSIPSFYSTLALKPINHLFSKKSDDYARISRDPRSPGSSEFAIQDLIVVIILQCNNRNDAFSSCSLRSV